MPIDNYRFPGASAAARASLDRARADARLGLSTCHTSPHYYASWSPQGALLAVRETGTRQCQIPKSTRGQVTEFSRRSRTRLLRLMASVDRNALGKSLLVTLTYPRSFTMEASTFKRHFDTWSKRLRRTFPESAAVWKLEFTEAGQAHYHLIVTGVPFMARQWLSRTWYEVVKTGDERHLRAGTQVQRVKSYRKALAYAAKYVAKLSAGKADIAPGRFWGVVGRNKLPVSFCEWELERRDHSRLARVIRNVVSSQRKRPGRQRYPGRWAFCRGDRAERAVAWAAGLLR